MFSGFNAGSMLPFPPGSYCSYYCTFPWIHVGLGSLYFVVTIRFKKLLYEVLLNLTPTFFRFCFNHAVSLNISSTSFS